MRPASPRLLLALLAGTLAAPACADLGARPRQQIAQGSADGDAGPGGGQSSGGSGGKTDTPDGGGTQSGGASPTPGPDSLLATVDGPFVPSASAEVVR